MTAVASRLFLKALRIFVRSIREMANKTGTQAKIISVRRQSMVARYTNDTATDMVDMIIFSGP